MTTLRALAAPLAVALAIAGCSESESPSPSAVTLPAPPIPTLSWQACADGSAGPGVDVSTFKCAQVAVPKDYSDPNGASIRLAVVQHSATDPANRIGTLFFNPGGPGGAGTSQLPEWIGYFPDQVKAKFDIVSWDPRGVGASTAVQCFGSAEAEGDLIGPLDAFPVTEAEVQPYKDGFATAAQNCAKRNGDLLELVSTADTARDLDVLRQAAGDDKLSYWGVSYGTYLGATYLNLFPDKVRAVVLDGNIDPDAWTNNNKSSATESVSLRIGSPAAADESVDAFMKFCGETTTAACAFSAGSAEATAKKWSDLLGRLRDRPLNVGSGDDAKTITYPTIVSQIDDAMDIVSGWPDAAASLQKLWELSEAPAPATPPTPVASPSPTQAPAEAPYAGPEQYWSIACGDSPQPAADAWPKLATEAARTAAGDSGLNLVWADFPCATWQAKAKLPYNGPWNADTAAKILVVNNTHDPSTPLANGKAMIERLHTAQLLTVEGYGHTALLNPSACAYAAIASYLFDGKTLPTADAVCAQDKKPFEA